MDPKAILKTRETFEAWHASTSPKERVYPNQLIAARRVLRAFVYHHNQALLWAEMQSGKTGTYQVIITFLLACGIVDHVYILCGSEERTLRKQAQADVITHNARFRGKIEVLFRGSLIHRLKKSSLLRLHRTLIVVDESHLDQTKDMVLPRALDAIGLDLSGSAECHAILRRYGAYILTVDATPYSEVCAKEHLHRDALLKKDTAGTIHKTVVRLLPGEEYVGVKKLLRSGHIKPGGYISENRKVFIDALKANPGKYAIVRVTRRSDEKEMRGICTDLGIPVLRYTGKHKDIAISKDDIITGRPSFTNKPSTTTVVMVKGCLRAGKRVPKTHLGFVWVCSKTPNTDVVLQGLLGRCCGYYPDGTTLPDVYISPVFLPGGEREAEMKRYLNSPYTCPSYATNVKEIKNTKDYDKTQTPAARIGGNSLFTRITAFRKETGTKGFPGGGRNAVAQDAITLLQTQTERVLSPIKGSLRSAQMEEIRAFIPTLRPTEVVVRCTTGGDQLKWATSLLSGSSLGETDTVQATNKNRKVALIAHPETTMVVFYTDAKGPMRASPLKTRFGKENGKSVFSPSKHPSPPPLEPEPKSPPSPPPKSPPPPPPPPNGVDGDPDIIIDDPSPDGVDGDPDIIIDDPSPNGVDGDPDVIIDDPSHNGVDGDPDVIIDDPPDIQPITSLWLWLLLALIGLLCIFAMYVHVNNQPPSKYLTLPVENAAHDPLPRWHTLV